MDVQKVEHTSTMIKIAGEMYVFTQLSSEVSCFLAKLMTAWSLTTLEP